MIKKLIAMTAIVSILLLSLAGCGETPNFLGGPSNEEKQMIKSSEVFIPIEKVRTLNPIISKDEDAYYVDRLIYEGLFEYDEKLTLKTALADSYTYAADDTSVTIQIKKGIQWQDGKELNADDVKFTIDALISASYSNNTLYSSSVSNIKSTKLDGKDPYSITIYFNNTSNIAMNNFTFPIVPKHQFKSVEDAKRLTSNFIPIGTGPYRVTEYNELSHIELQGYDGYHGGNVPSNTLNLQIIPDKRDVINLMEVNNVSLTFSKDLDRDTVYTNKNVNVINFPSNEVELVGFNFRNAIMKNGKVRKALASAINTKDIIEGAYYKNGIENNTIYYPNYLGVPSDKTNNLYDIVQAKKLLAEAGFVDRNADGLVEGPNNETITINILVNSEDQSRSAAAQMIRDNLAQLPIQTNLVSKEWNSYLADLESGNYDIYVGGYQLRDNYDLRFLLHTNYANPIGYSNLALDALLDRMESGISQKDRLATYTQINDILVNDLPYFCLLYKTYGMITSPALKGDINPLFFDLYRGCGEWYSLFEAPEAPEADNSETAGNILDVQ